MPILDQIEVDGITYDFKDRNVDVSEFLTIDLDSINAGTPNQINADTLGGYKASDYILKSELFPIGSIYISLNSVNPSTLFGGTWQQIQGRFLLGVDGSHPVNQTGGEEKHTLNSNEIPSHYHNLKEGSHTFSWGQTKSNNVYLKNTEAAAGNTPGNAAMTSQGIWSSTESTGENQAHNNMPPYLAVYMWKRIS